MQATVLTDNSPVGEYRGEWGLSLLIEYGDTRFLLDTGASPLFAENAEKLGVDLSTVDIGVLSHAHYDHSGGLRTFFEKNRTAPFYLRAGAKENCYRREGLFFSYNGIRRGTLSEYASRLQYADGLTCIAQGAYLLPSPPSDGRRVGLYRRRGLRFFPDDFSHEHSLVLKAGDGLAVFSGCTHCGADQLLCAVQRAFPDQPVRVLVGGLHLFRSSRREVEDFAARLDQLGLSRLVTGHCTGDAAFAVLKQCLGERAAQLRCGDVICF